MTATTTRDPSRTVCLVSSHPLARSLLAKLLSRTSFRIQSQRLPFPVGAHVHRLVHTKAAFYLVDAHMPQPALRGLVSRLLEAGPTSRILVIGEELKEQEAFALLRLGVKGLLSYAEAEQLPQALQAVASGGIWVPRRQLSRFVDSMLVRGRAVNGRSPAFMSPREGEVLEALLQNLSNKEIAARLHISERTVKFHVSNLLAKFGVSGRQALILTCLASGTP